jgi:hypothetical protein
LEELIEKIEDKTTIILEKEDVALVIRGEDEGFEMHLPKMEDPDAPVPSHVVLIVALALRLKDDTFVNNVMDWFDNKVEEKLGGEIGSTDSLAGSDSGAVPDTSTKKQ